jgi:hypothetical protein
MNCLTLNLSVWNHNYQPQNLLLITLYREWICNMVTYWLLKILWSGLRPYEQKSSPNLGSGLSVVGTPLSSSDAHNASYLWQQAWLPRRLNFSTTIKSYTHKKVAQTNNQTQFSLVHSTIFIIFKSNIQGCSVLGETKCQNTRDKETENVST